MDLEAIGARDVEVLYYGYDEADFKDYEARNDNRQVIFHGGLLGNDRNPEPLVKALRRMKNERIEEVEGLQIRLAGGVSPDVVGGLEEAGLASELTLLGMVSRMDVIDEIAGAGLLLLPINVAPNCKGRVPGKLFELMRSGKPILALGPVDGDVARLLEETGTGRIFDYDDTEGVYQFLLDFFRKGLDVSKQGRMAVSDLSNEAGAMKLSRLLDDAVAKRRSGVGRQRDPIQNK